MNTSLIPKIIPNPKNIVIDNKMNLLYYLTNNIKKRLGSGLVFSFETAEILWLVKIVRYKLKNTPWSWLLK
jgi:hypothetical protein